MYMRGFGFVPMNRIASFILVGIVCVYRVTLGPFMGGHCRFDPTCSQYMLDAVAKHGPWRGAWRGLKRIGRCHPWGGHGYDPA
jgi:uncharacterized protein